MTWQEIIGEEQKKEYYQKMIPTLKTEYLIYECYPPKENIFKAFNSIPSPEDVKVVILGQDPYHGLGEAHGLSFSVKNGIKMPPSLLNIFKELYSDLGIKREKSDLTDWAKQGILLLNSIMTVEKDKPLSHKDKGWEIFTDTVISKLNERVDPVIFVLWGSFARSKKELITNKNHKIIESVHPSPLSASRGFFGSKPFSKINNYLKSMNKNEIKW